MINQQTIILNNSTNGSVISKTSPFTMVLSTSAFTPSYKIWKITYDFGNGDIQEKTLSLTPNSTNSLLPIQSEPGDPRNYPVTTNYYFDDSSTKTYSINVKFYEIGQTLPEEVTFSLDLYLPTLESIFGLYENIKLLGSRSSGLDNQLIYLFESQNPNYLIPVLARI